MPARYLCIHAHCYQPPRENPWLEAIELQDSAYPYHDWNERVMAECYAPNTSARILDEQQRIVQIVNNYQNISYNFGPTLLSWMQEKAPEAYALVLEADRASAARFSGHGSAMAQCYNHLIMPLANSRDKHTQVRWGIDDFQYRFGRAPEGMWLPETAVDLDTLSILAEMGIRFTVLAPSQAQSIRPVEGGEWEDVGGSRIDPTRPYLCKMASGKTIALFFYDGPVSQSVAFERLLDNGEKFSGRLLSGFSDARAWPQLMHIATDGETYGHHHRFGEMALAWALRHIDSNGLAKITNYGEFLEQNPPTHEVKILENTAWSCAHGVGRWSTDCGCNTGSQPGWTQEWRAPLRAALDWLRDTVAPLYEQRAAAYLRYPWQARNDYIQVVLDRSPERRRRFLARHATRDLNDKEAVEVWKLLEMQRHAMLMYTSCGWFFSEVSGIETVQVIQYAGRVVQLASDVAGPGIEPEFLQRLARARSNLPERRDGAAIYEASVKPAIVTLERVGAHFAVSSLFEEYPKQTNVFSYAVDTQDFRTMRAGRNRLAMGRIRITSGITQSSGLFTFGALHFGDHNVHADVREYGGRKAYDRTVAEVGRAFSHADLAEVISLLEQEFGPGKYSIKSLFRDEQRRILNLILDTTLEDAEMAYRQLYENHAPLMRYLTDLHIPLPEAMRSTAAYALNSRLRHVFASPEVNAGEVQSDIEEAATLGVALDTTTLEYTLRKTLERLSDAFSAEPDNLAVMTRLARLVAVARRLPFPVVFWSIQNKCWTAIQITLAQMRARATAGDAEAHDWVDQFTAMCTDLSLRLPV